MNASVFIWLNQSGFTQTGNRHRSSIFAFVAFSDGKPDSTFPENALCPLDVYGGLVASAGSAIVVGGSFVFLLLLLAPVFIRRVGAEDRLMEQQFPDAYPDYKARTKKLIPFVF